MNNPNPQSTIHLHGVAVLEGGDEEYSDNPNEIEFWCVYIRTETPNDKQQPFNISNEQDFPTFDAAKAHAEGLAQTLHGDSTQWNHD